MHKANLGLSESAAEQARPNDWSGGCMAVVALTGMHLSGERVVLQFWSVVLGAITHSKLET